MVYHFKFSAKFIGDCDWSHLSLADIFTSKWELMTRFIVPMLGVGLELLSKYPPPKFAGHFLENLVNVTMYTQFRSSAEISDFPTGIP